MKRQHETALEQWCVKWARSRGIVVAKLKECDGIPDRIFFVPGGLPVIGEFKAEGRRGRNLQERTQPWYLEKLTADGYSAHCWDTRKAFLYTMAAYEGCRIASKRTIK